MLDPLHGGFDESGGEGPVTECCGIWRLMQGGEPWAMQTQENKPPVVQAPPSDAAVPGMVEIGRRLLRALAIALCVTYVWWNIAWLAQWSAPPAIFQYLTGLPAPTTGGLRSIGALCHGKWRESLRWNAMAVPLMLMLPASMLAVVVGWEKHRRVRLPPVLFRAWGVCLIAAWLLQLANPRFSP